MFVRLSTVIDNLMSLLFPERCVGCKKEKTFLCEQCAQRIESAEIGNDEHIHAAIEYRDPVARNSIRLLKYKNAHSVARSLGTVLHNLILDTISSTYADINLSTGNPQWLIIPSPMSEKKLRDRGYNQAELLTREVCLIDENMSFTLHTDVLYKIRDTESQVSLKDRRDRLTNLCGAFSVRKPGLVRGKKIILVDDVYTTGATFKEMRKTLRAAGAARVECFAVAH